MILPPVANRSHKKSRTLVSTTPSYRCSGDGQNLGKQAVKVLACGVSETQGLGQLNMTSKIVCHLV
jgi:hypothetical protein